MRKIPHVNRPIFESGESHGPAQGVITERTSKEVSRPREEDDAPAESRFRRTQQVLSPAGRTRNAPGMPLEMPDGDSEWDGEAAPRPRNHFDEPARRWWKPSSITGRVILGVATLMVIGSAAAAWIMAKRYIERDSRFLIRGVDSIQSAGLSQVSRDEMLPVFGEDIGKNIFFVNLGERRKQLEQIPWVEHATVMRLLPDQIRVNVVERTPIAFVRQGQQIGLVDADGILLTMPAAMMTQHHFSFPVVTGIDGGDPQPSRHARMAVYQQLIHDLDAGGQHLSEQISEIDLTDPEDARVLMPEQGGDILAHFGDEQFLARYQRYKAHIAEWRQQYPHLAAVDLRYDQQVVLEMKPGADTGTPAASGQSVTLASNGQAPNVKTATPKAAAPKPVAKKPQSKQSKPTVKPTAKRHPEVKRVAANAKNVKPNQKPRASAANARNQ